MDWKKTTCRTLIVSLLAFSFGAARAGMIDAAQAQPPSLQADRTLVLATVSRADTAAQLQALGVDPQQARERVAAMGDQEVAQLAQGIRTAPAGGDGGTVVAILVVAAAVWYFAFRR